MANRSYLYSLSNRPTSYADRPETINGLSEWPYAVPFAYRVLMSGDPQLCPSFISDGLSDDPAKQVYAISSVFEPGYARLKRLLAVVRSLVSDGSAPGLARASDETAPFLDTHRDQYLLLETIELDLMLHDSESELRASVERELAACARAGSAVDALSSSIGEAGGQLVAAAQQGSEGPLGAFHGLMFTDDFDDRRNDAPLGLFWDNDLYFALWNRQEFQANQT